MKNLNLVVLIGRLTADPEMKNTAGGKQLARFSVATNYSWKGNDGEWQEGVDFHDIVAWGKEAEKVVSTVKKAEMVCVKGKLRVNKWQDKTGQTRRTVEIVAQQVNTAESLAGKKVIQDYLGTPEEENI